VSWLDAHRERAPALVEAALAFEPGGFPPGAEGVRWLARAIDRFRAHPAPDDRAFVEGAGACLGLLLLDHVGGGALVRRGETTRLRLGRYGSVDLFGAIERVLDAGDSRSELAVRIREAEAEARGEGARSRVFSVFEAELEKSHPGLSIVDSSDDGVWLEGGIEVDLRRVVSATADLDRAAVVVQVARVLALVPSGAGASDAPGLPLEEIVPRLVARTFLDGFEAQGTHLASRPLTESIRVAYVIVFRDRARYLRADELTRHPDLPQIALANLASRSRAARFDWIESANGPLVVGCTGDGHDAARLLLPSLHDVLAPEIGSPFLVAIPHRDCLLAAPDGDDGRRAIGDRAQAAFARAPHAISLELLRVRPNGLGSA
jgi:uncharacterized protein YtpQ (UPF0354 family)